MALCTCADPDALKDKLEEVHQTLYGKKQKVEELGQDKDDPGEPGKMDRVRFCHWAAPEWGPIGESMWTNAFRAAQLAIALLNAEIQGEIADKQQDLAEGYYQQAKYKWNRFAYNYRPLEWGILWEASNEPIKNLDCAGPAERAKNAINQSFDYMDSYVGRTAKAYRLCMDESAVSQLAYSRNLLEIDTHNYNLQDEQWFVDFKNDQRWNRRSNILNLGRNLGAVAMKYGDVALKLMNDVSNIANRAASSLSQALGYYGARFDTYYPTTYLSGQGQGLVGVRYSTQRTDPYEPAGSVYPTG